MDTNCSIVRTKFDERIVARTTAAKFRRRVTYSGVQERRIDPTPEVLMGTGWFCQELCAALASPSYSRRLALN